MLGRQYGESVDHQLIVAIRQFSVTQPPERSGLQGIVRGICESRKIVLTCQLIITQK